MANLQDVVAQLQTLNNSTLEIALYSEPMYDLVSSLEKMMDKFIQSNDELRYQMMENQREASIPHSAITPGADKNPPKEKDEGMGLLKKLGLGAALGAMGGGLLKGAAGIASMGIAISAFFGGLVVGDKILGSDWFKSGLDFKYLQKAAKGFSSIVQELTGLDLVVLGGIMGLSAVGGWKAGLGLGVMGAAISSFFGGLLVGNALFNWIGFDFDYSGLSKAAKGFSEIITNLGLPAVGILGAILGGSGFAGMASKDPFAAAKGVAAMGAAISAFFGGLLIGDATLSFLKAGEWGGLAGATKAFNDAIVNLDGPALAALAILFAAGGVIGTFAKWGGVKVAAGMGALGAGIGAFFTGFAGIGQFAGEGDNIAALMANFSKAIGNLSGEAMITLGGLMAAGGVLGMVGAKGSAYFVGGMGALGAGIASFFVGLDGIAKVGSWFGVDGSSSAAMVDNFTIAINKIAGIDAEKTLAASGAIGAVSVAFAKWKAVEFADMFTSFAGLFKDDPITKFVNGIKPLENLDPTKYDGFEKIVDKLQYFSTLDLTNAVKGMEKLEAFRQQANFDADMTSSVLFKEATNNADLKEVSARGGVNNVVTHGGNNVQNNFSQNTYSSTPISNIGGTNTSNIQDFIMNGYSGRSLIGGF